MYGVGNRKHTLATKDVMKAVSRMVTDTVRYEHVTTVHHHVLRDILHWLPVHQRENFSISVAFNRTCGILVLPTSMTPARRHQTFPGCSCFRAAGRGDLLYCHQLKRRLVVEVSTLQDLLSGTHYAGRDYSQRMTTVTGLKTIN